MKILKVQLTQPGLENYTGSDYGGVEWDNGITLCTERQYEYLQMQFGVALISEEETDTSLQKNTIELQGLLVQAEDMVVSLASENDELKLDNDQSNIQINKLNIENDQLKTDLDAATALLEAESKIVPSVPETPVPETPSEGGE